MATIVIVCMSAVSSTQTPGGFACSRNEMKAVLGPRGFSDAAAAQRTWLGDRFVGACLFSEGVLPSSGESSGVLGYETDRTYRTRGDAAYF